MSPRRHDFPGHLARLIEEAGASAYRWHEEELAAWVDKAGYWRTLSTVLHRGTLVALVAVLCWFLATPVALMPALGAVVLVLTWAWTRFRSVPWPASMLALLVALDPLGEEVNEVLLGPVAVSALGLFLIRPRFRSMSALIAATLVAGAGEFALSVETYGVLATLLVLVVYGVAAWLSGLRSLPQPWARLSKDDLQARPPSPPSHLPWLVRRVKAAKIKNEPGEIKRKKIGADGERRTAMILLALRRGRRTRIAHDVMVPGAKTANADHVVLARSGLYIIDSKQFGSRDDPGEVTYDMSSRTIVHRTRRGSRSIESSLKTAAWAVEGISNLVGVQGRAILAIHNAHVSGNLRIERNGISIEIIPAMSLLDRIDGAPASVNVAQFAAGRMGMVRMRSATTGSSPQIVAPRGLSGQGKTFAKALVTDLTSPEVEVSGKRARRTPEPRPEPAAEQARPEREKPRTAVLGRSASVSPATVEMPTATTVSQPTPEVEPPILLSPADRISDQWHHMRMSSPAPLDDVEEAFRDLRRGDALYLIEFTDSDVKTKDVIAISGVCEGSDGHFVWVCGPEQYQVYVDTGKEVSITTVSVKQLMPHKSTGGETA